MPPTLTPSDAEVPAAIPDFKLSARSLWGVLGLLVLTVGSLGLAWLFPDQTLLHFLWVAQAVPVLYWVLVWWGTAASHSADDAS